MKENRRGSPELSMKSVLRVILVLGGLASLMQAARADGPDSFIRIQCMSAINRLEIGTFMTWNVCNDGCRVAAPLASQGVYQMRDFLNRYLHKPFVCDLGLGQKAVVSIVDHGTDRIDGPRMTLDVAVGAAHVAATVSSDGSNGDLDLVVQEFAAYAPSRFPATVATNLCTLVNRNPITLPDEMTCHKVEMDPETGKASGLAEATAVYEKRNGGAK
jgi:hypothetical protein